MIFLPGFMCLYKFTGGDSDVFRGDHLTLFINQGSERHEVFGVKEFKSVKEE